MATFKNTGAVVFHRVVRAARSALAKYLIAVGLAVIGISLDDLVQPELYQIPLLVLLICATLSALIGGWGPGLLTLALGVIGIDLVLAHPFGAVALISPEGEIRLGTFLVVALGFCCFGAWLRSAYLTVLSQSEQLREAFETRRELAVAEVARAKAEEANQAKDEFLALISHELRSPLQGMLSWLDLLRQDNVNPRIKESAPEVMRRCVERQTRLVDDLLEASRLIAHKVEIGDYPVDIARELGDVVQEFAVLAQEKGVELRSRLKGTGLVKGDPGRLRQVIWNLLSNALKSTAAGGAIDASCEQKGSVIELVFTDNGEGIDPGFLPRIFDRFTQADTGKGRRRGGLGLGLFIAKQIIELHGGTITTASEGLGKGARFEVRLPCALNAAAFDFQASTPMKVSCNGVKVLLVEDDPETLVALAELLESRGAHVRSAASASEALQVYIQDKPDILLSDIAMPEEDGYSLIRKIRNLEGGLGEIPAIALSGYASNEYRMEALTAGFDAHLAKPVNIDALEKKIVELSSDKRVRE